MTDQTPKNGTQDGNGAGGEINVEEPKQEQAQEPGVRKVLRFQMDQGTEINLVIPHIQGFRVEPPEDKGDTWHQLPKDERPAVLVIQQLGVQSGINMPMDEALRICHVLTQMISDWHEYSITAPRPTLLITPNHSGRPPSGIMVPNGVVPRPSGRF